MFTLVAKLLANDHGIRLGLRLRPVLFFFPSSMITTRMEKRALKHIILVDSDVVRLVGLHFLQLGLHGPKLDVERHGPGAAKRGRRAPFFLSRS